MKRIMIVAMLIGIASLTACGGGGGNGGDCTAGEAVADEMFEDFGSILGSQQIIQCIDQLQADCPCPNGGTVSVALVQGSVEITFDDCTSDDDNVFDGELTATAAGVISGQMDPFGDCSNVTVTNIDMDNNCTGTITGTCAGQDISCNPVDNGQGGCDLECDCR